MWLGSYCYNHVTPLGFDAVGIVSLYTCHLLGVCIGSFILLAIIMSPLQGFMRLGSYCYNHVTPSGFYVVGIVNGIDLNPERVALL